MEVQVRPFVDVRKCAMELGCSIPTDLAILPRNFETAESKDELYHENVVVDIRSLWRQAGVVETRLEGDGKKFLTIDEKNADWIGPTVFIGGSLLLQNPTMLNIALNVLSNYITDFFKGHPGKHEASVKFVYEKETTKNMSGEERTFEHMEITADPDFFEKLDAKKLKQLMK